MKIMSKDDWIIDRPFFKNLLDKKDLVLVEIGVESGWNAYHILKYLSVDKVFLIDPYCNYNNTSGHGILDDNIANICKKSAYDVLKEYKEAISWIYKFSSDAVEDIPDSVDAIYIDGCHLYSWVKEDIRLYYPKIKSGGFLAGHDYKNSEPGVIRAVNEFAREYNIRGYNEAWDWYFRI